MQAHRLRDFRDANIRGPDFVWAATGAALEAFGRHPVVKRTDAPGAVLTVAEFLRRMVVAFVVNRLFAVQGEATATLDDPTTYPPTTAARRPSSTASTARCASGRPASKAAWTATWRPTACGATTFSSRWCRPAVLELAKPATDERATLEYIQNHLAGDGGAVVARQRGLLDS